MCPVTTAAANERVYFFHNDHLGAPQAMSDLAGRTVWTAEYEPFGRAAVNQDPDGDGQQVENNLRFPGQYYDAETGLHYNYHRNYDPETGRYLQPDPAGIRGGENHLYVYAGDDPINSIDPLGLCKWKGVVTIKLGGNRKGAAGAVVLMVMNSECCNKKQAQGVYTAFCGGVSVMPKIWMPVQIATSVLKFDGPDTPSDSDPKGLFSYLGFGAPIGSYARLRTGSLVASTGWAWEAGNDLGLDALLGFTIGSGTTTCCEK